MFLNIMTEILKGLIIGTGSYGNKTFPDPLTKKEEEKLLEKMLNNDKEARNKLIEHNLRLVAHIVKKYDNGKIDTDDLISIGTIGLIKGIDTFSNKNGAKLTTYAARCVEKATFISKNFLRELMIYSKESIHNYNFLIR